ncbi:uncharacterized protein [Oscarella lobularis]|uniref:uncharacterized protein n=1 Tax=Oscarella lobularis TaxID=121494 RepID=UPI0033133C21
MKGFLLTAFALTLASALPTDEQRVRRSVETPGFFGGDSEGNGSNSTAEASCTTSAAALSVQMHSFVIEIRELRDSYGTTRLRAKTDQKIPYQDGWPAYSKPYGYYDAKELADWGECYPLAGTVSERVVWDHNNLKRFFVHLQTVLCSEYGLRSANPESNETHFVAEAAKLYDELVTRVSQAKRVIDKCGFVAERSAPATSPYLPGQLNRVSATGVSVEDNWGVLMNLFVAVWRAYENLEATASGAAIQPPSWCDEALKKTIDYQRERQ